MKEGDHILLSPPFDLQQKDLGGAILAEGEDVSMTNNLALARAAAQRNGNDRPGREGEVVPGVPVDGPSDGGIRARNGNAEPRTEGANPAARGPRPNFEEIRKQFDKNGDGELDETERQAMRESFGGQFGGRTRRQGSGESVEGGEQSSERTNRRSREGRTGSEAENGERSRRQPASE